jgi:hypothetical protein
MGKFDEGEARHIDHGRVGLVFRKTFGEMDTVMKLHVHYCISTEGEEGPNCEDVMNELHREMLAYLQLKSIWNIHVAQFLDYKPLWNEICY